MRANTAGRAIVLTCAGALVLAGTIVPASGAASPPWRPVKTFGPAEGVWSDNFAVSGANDAWSTWIACKPCGSKTVIHFFVEHSAGTTWKRVRVPASLTNAAENSVAIGASSFRDAWLIDPPASSNATRARVLRWDGSKWLTRHIPAWAVHFNLSGTLDVVPLVFGARSVWIFSMGQDAFTNPDHYVARYNGRTWTKMQLPGVPSQVSVLSQDDIWALGSTVATKRKPATSILMHWNGSRWSSIAVPKAHVPPHSTEFVLNPVAVGSNSVWIQRDIERGTAGAATLKLLHWNGRFWSREALPTDISAVDYMTQDGHGGLWLVANGLKPRYHWFFYHLNSGRWTRQRVPAPTGTRVGDLTGIAWIPGTRGVWATGNMFLPGTNGGILGAILKRAG